LGFVRISQSQGKKLKLRSKTHMSPVLEKCCLRLCANHSYDQSENDIKVLTGIEVGHTTLHRLVQKAEIPITLSHQSVDTLSVDGGKVRVRCEEGGAGQWRDYKALSCHGSVVEAFFQQPQALQAWSEEQPLSPILTLLGDGHPGIWKIISQLGGAAVVIKREILDWYHLKENLYKVGGSMRRIKVVENLLWLGRVEEGIGEFDGLKSAQVIKFKNYLEKHQGRIPNYQEYQRMGITIGSGSVESKIKQIGARVKISGASWKRQNVAQILRLRCAYLSNSQRLSISA
jgi:hypothetical protein